MRPGGRQVHRDYKTIVVENADAPEHREVMRQISRSWQGADGGSAEPGTGATAGAASDEMLAFVSLAYRERRSHARRRARPPSSLVLAVVRTPLWPGAS